MAVGTPEPFEIRVSEEELQDLKKRLARTRWPDQAVDDGPDWNYGAPTAYIKELADSVLLPVATMCFPPPYPAKILLGGENIRGGKTSGRGGVKNFLRLRRAKKNSLEQQKIHFWRNGKPAGKVWGGKTSGGEKHAVITGRIFYRLLT